jgi:hypothetical protein
MFNKLADKSASTMEKVSAGVSLVGEFIQSGLSIASGAIDNFYAESLEKLDMKHESEIRAIDEKLQNEIELLQNNGMTKDEMLNKELQDAINAGNLEAIAQKEKEIAILKATKQANKAKEESNKDFARKKHKQEVALFNSKKAMDIVNATISFGLGLVNLWSTVWQLGPIAGAVLGGVMSGVLTGIYASQVAMIASQQPPPPPRFEQGTNFAPGGMALVGERGAELMSVPRGASITPADQTSSLLTPPVVNVRVMVGDRELRNVVATATVENQAFEGNR